MKGQQNGLSYVAEEFDLWENQYSEVYLLPFRVASEPYVRSFQYKVLNSILQYIQMNIYTK